MNKLSLEQLRNDIDSVDKQILTLLEERAALAKQVALSKRQSDAEPVYYRPEREAKILRAKLETYQGLLNKVDVAQIFRLIISACRSLQKQHVVAFLGPTGTFSQQAACQQFGNSEATLAKNTIGEVFRAVETKEADFAVVPIENTTTGIINETVDLLLNSPVKICGETTLSINFHLLSHATSLSKIKTLYLHPQAATQCHNWINQNLAGIKQITVSSNAEAARLAANDDSSAALAGEILTELYQLNKLAGNVQDTKNNTTRFLVIGNLDTPPSGDDKTALIVTAGHKPGDLHKLLEPLASAKANISLIASRPRLQQPWRYFFYLEIDGHQQQAELKTALSQLADNAFELKSLGSFPKALSNK